MDEIPNKMCMNCFCMYPPEYTGCPICGHTEFINEAIMKEDKTKCPICGSILKES